MNDDLALASLAAQRRALLTRRVSALELANLHLGRIATIGKALNAFIRVNPDEVRAAARAADRALARGERAPLLGVPIAIKDLADEQGVRNTAGSALRRRAPVASSDSTAVAKLRAAGAVFVGRTNLHEFAAGATNANPAFGPVLNPHDLSTISGGSSGGSGAAVAAGLGAAALGTDTGGSIRIPAALCGVVGLKPTYGRVSRAGVLPLSWSMDHVGPLTRTVADAGTLLRVMAGADPRDPSSVDAPLRTPVGVRGLRFSTGDPYFTARIDPAIARALRTALRLLSAAGMREVRTRIPFAGESDAIRSLIIGPEATAAHAGDLTPSRLRQISPEVRARLKLGLEVSAVDYLQAQRARTILTREVEEAFGVADVLVVPTVAAGAMPVGATHMLVAGKRQAQFEILVRFTQVFNLTGHPALALPVGFDARGLPISLQIVGRAYEEGTVLRVGAALERALDLDMTPAIAR